MNTSLTISGVFFFAVTLSFFYVLVQLTYPSLSEENSLYTLIGLPGLSQSESPYMERIREYKERDPYFSFELKKESYTDFLYAK